MILDEYDLGGLLRCAQIELGYFNEKWLLETEAGPYLLKRRHANLRRPPLVQAQHALVRHLVRRVFPHPP
jgi:Ser/Thr protein kinase RdoA (MazF antagonist)